MSYGAHVFKKASELEKVQDTYSIYLFQFVHFQHKVLTAMKCADATAGQCTQRQRLSRFFLKCLSQLSISLGADQEQGDAEVCFNLGTK